MTNIDWQQTRVLSVDLFDTLLLRSVPRPADVFPLVGERGRASGLLRPHVAAPAFAAARASAEATARRQAHERTGCSEVSLADIYAAMPEGLFTHGADPVARLEFEVERGLVFAHAGTLSLIQRARAEGVPVVALSDTYFGEAQLRTLLTAAGIAPGLFHAIYSSSAHGASKHEGGLYRRLLDAFPGIDPDAITHVGDDAHADGVRARQAGVRAVTHDTGGEAVDEALRLERLRYAEVPLVSLRRAAAVTAAPADDDERWWFSLGAAVLGPLCAGFADWVVDECRRDGIRTVRPLMREGALFATMIDNAAAAAGVALDVAPLYASRAATWLAGLDRFDAAAITKLLQRQPLTIRETFATLGLSLRDAAPGLESAADVTLGDAPRIRTSGGTVAEALASHLQRPDVRVRVEQTMAASRTLLRQYLRQSCGNAEAVAIVDLGFHASTGRAIERAWHDAGAPSMHHLLAIGADALTHAWAEGADVRVFAGGPGDHADLASAIARHPAVLEMLLMEGGTTVGYRREGLRVVPVLDAEPRTDFQQPLTAACRAGILAFQAQWLRWRQLRPSATVPAPHVLLQPVHRLITMPATGEVKHLASCLHEDNDGSRSVRPLADVVVPEGTSIEHFLEGALSAAAIDGHTWLWPAGTCELRWPGALARRWTLAAGHADGAPPAIPAVATRLREAGIRECIVWGAGEAGTALIRAARHERITVLLVTDSNPATWGTTLDGVPVVSPEEARRRGNHVFAIGSCAFADEIEQGVRRRYVDAPERPRVFSVRSPQVAAA